MVLNNRSRRPIALGHWRSAKVSQHVGTILSGCECDCVSGGGGRNSRWRRFVLDAADLDKLDAAKTELHNLLQKPQLLNIPVLVLSNKNDLPNALTVEETIEKLYVRFIAP